MMPGAGMNPRQMAMMMRKMGIDMQELDDVEEVRVRTKTTDFVFSRPQVTVTRGQGTEAWQVSGKPKQVPRGSNDPAASAQAADPKLTTSGPTTAAPSPSLAFTKDDVEMVMQAANVPEAKAREALTATGGDIAEAIVRLQA